MLVLAAALGAYLVDLGHGAPTRSLGATAPAASGPGTTTPTTGTGPTSTTSTTTTTTVPGGASPSPTVPVLVANASQTNGIAAYYTKKLSSLGWGTLTPVTAATAEATSTVYFASGRQADALAVAAELGLPSSAVRALATGAPVVGTTGADVVLVAGDDLAAKVPAASGTG